MKQDSSSRLPAFWIVACAWLNCAGWILSALHLLNPTGYLATLALAVVSLWFSRHKSRDSRPVHFRPARWKWRLRHALPCCSFALAALAIIGGFLHAPNNYDALAYRIPRVMHWLAAERWHWIATDFPRLNVRACGFEWPCAPLILLTGNYRWVFIFNIIPFLCLPGLTFSVLTRLTVKPRVAWHWMWLFPTAYCFLLQVGGAANDLAGAFFALASVDFALRARERGNFRYAALSILAAALLSGGKSSNLPLLLPCFIAILPSIFLLLRHPLKSTGVVVAAILCSLVPISLLNVKYCGDWSGLNAEYPQFHKSDPLLYLPTNAILLSIQNFMPPVFPIANWWNSTIYKLAPAGYIHRLEQNFEQSAAHFKLAEMQNEEGAGFGFSLSILITTSVIASLACRRRPGAFGGRISRFQWALLLSPWFSMIVLMSKSGLATFARLVVPYYGLLIPLFLILAGQQIVIRKTWWRVLTIALLLVAAIPVIINPGRPLWPARTFFGHFESSRSTLLTHARNVYAVYGDRAEAFAPVRAVLPPDAKVLGMITYDDPEASLWLPYGSRRIEHVTGKETVDDMRQRGIRYVLTSEQRTQYFFGGTPQQWAAAHEGEVIAKIPLDLRASTGPVEWDLIRIRDRQPAPPHP